MEVTWGRTVRIWWAHAWRAWGLYLLPVILWVAYALYHPAAAQALRLPIDLVIFVLAILFNIFTLRIVLWKTFAEFRIALEPRDAKL